MRLLARPETWQKPPSELWRVTPDKPRSGADPGSNPEQFWNGSRVFASPGMTWHPPITEPATTRSLTKPVQRRHLRLMSAGTPILPHLRRSLLGAWLAVAYALAVLAAGLSPAPAHAALDGAPLCSGLSAPPPDAPAPTGDAGHCKGCPVNPAMAVPPASHPAGVARQARHVALPAGASPGVVATPAWRLPPSHAPPYAAA